MRRCLIILVFIFLTGCSDKAIETVIENDKQKITISYPVTNINVLDDAITSYINKVHTDFKEKYKYFDKPELNISYTYKELNEDVVNVSLNAEIIAGKQIDKIKTFTYNKKAKKFLTMEDIVEDIVGFDYELKKQLTKKYQNVSIDYLEELSYDFFTIDDENLTVYFNQGEIRYDNDNLVCLDVPLSSLNLLIDIDKNNGKDIYLNLKKRNINESSKVVALTFDDGPSKYTDEILDILDKEKAVATFFVIGNKVQFYNKTLVKMLKGGNEIGNHSYTHKWLNRLYQEEFVE
ncbi:MAG: polysaccharide deacetylase family protein [Bacilli bacterium]|nr:polysaccharide deacetylase family protein [Bacilli bacterium]